MSAGINKLELVQQKFEALFLIASFRKSITVMLYGTQNAHAA
jgi:hypothetical protein